MARPTHSIPRQRVQQMLPLQDGRCWWHGGLISEGEGDTGRPTIEHLQHVSEGGDNRVSNIVIACRACNMARANKPGWAMHPSLAGTLRAKFLDAALIRDFHLAMKFKPRPEAQHNAHVRTWKWWMFQSHEEDEARVLIARRSNSFHVQQYPGADHFV